MRSTTTRRTTRLFGFAITALVLLGSAQIANAQYGPPPGYGGYPPPPPPPARAYRSSLVLGFALGGGGIAASGCDPRYCGGAFAIEGHIGGMLQPKMALVGDVWLNIKGIDGTDGTFSQSLWTAAIQFWPADILWLKGGVGFGHLQTSSASVGVIEDETALGVMVAGGVELLHATNMALDLQFRFGSGFYSPTLNNYAFMVGLSWY